MADYSWIAPLIQGVASQVGNSKAQTLTDADRTRLQDILGRLGGLKNPNFDTSKLESQAGTIDPALRSAQMKAIAQLKNIQDSGGLTLEDKAAQNAALNRSDRSASAAQQHVLDSAAARGTLGSGATLAAQLQNSQGAAERANAAGMQTAASAQKRYLDSILSQGQMAGQMTDQDYRAKQARDVMNQYNQKNANTYGQQGFQNEVGKITGQMPGIASLQGLDQSEAGRIRDQYASMGAGAGAIASDLTRDRGGNPSGGAGGTSYSTPPLQDSGSSSSDWANPYGTYDYSKIDSENDR